jgi:hypothetical protein
MFKPKEGALAAPAAPATGGAAVGAAACGEAAGAVTAENHPGGEAAARMGPQASPVAEKEVALAEAGAPSGPDAADTGEGDGVVTSSAPPDAPPSTDDMAARVDSSAAAEAAEAMPASTKRAHVVLPAASDSASCTERPDSPRIVRLTLKAHERAEAVDAAGILDRLAPQMLEYAVARAAPTPQSHSRTIQP